jgi:hypothetical protein
METIVELILVVICQYPGAFIRWLIFRRKKFKEYLLDDWYYNCFPVVVLLILYALVYQIFR